MDFDDALHRVGEFGWLQLFHLAIISSTSVAGALYAIPMAFIGIAPHFTCAGKPDEDPCKVTPPCEKFVYDSSFTSIATEVRVVCIPSSFSPSHYLTSSFPLPFPFSFFLFQCLFLFLCPYPSSSYSLDPA